MIDIDEATESEMKNAAIGQAAAMQRLLKNADFLILWKRMEDEVEIALENLSDEEQDDNTLKQRQMVFNKCKQWIELPLQIISEAREDMTAHRMELKNLKEQEENLVEKENKYTGTP